MIQIGKWIVAAVVLVVLTSLAYVEVRHRLTQGHFMPLGLHADIVVHNATIGIPGITKMYEGTLTNYGILPAIVERCTYTSDTATPGTFVAFNIEQLQPAKHQWLRVIELAKPELCSPMPTSMGNTRWVSSWLWPGQTLSTMEQATGAQGFRKNDTLRFAIIPDVTGESKLKSSYVTPSFALDESFDGNEGVSAR